MPKPLLRCDGVAQSIAWGDSGGAVLVTLESATKVRLSLVGPVGCLENCCPHRDGAHAVMQLAQVVLAS